MEKRLIDINGKYRLDADDYTGCAILFDKGNITVTNDDGCYICEFDAKKLPTVNAVEVSRGKWIDRGYEVECPFCGFTCNDTHYLGKAIACPNCAATMEV